MAKSLNEFAGELKEFIINSQSDAHNKGSVNIGRYNNLKLVMEPRLNNRPHVVIDMTLSSAEFDILSGQKRNGGLGADERYVLKWLAKSGVLPSLQETWKYISKHGNEAQ